MIVIFCFDFYVYIYKVLCLFMIDIFQQFSCLDVDDVDEFIIVLVQFEVLLDVVDYYVQCENEFMYLFIEVCCVGVSVGIVVEYVEYLVVIVVLCVDVLVLCVLLLFMLVYWFYQCFVEFVVDNFEYMVVEESCYNQVLWVVYSDVELYEIYGCILASIGLCEMSEVLCWMVLVFMFVECVMVVGGLLFVVWVFVFVGMCLLFNDVVWIKFCWVLNQVFVLGLVNV